jgi:SNF2-related domain
VTTAVTTMDTYGRVEFVPRQRHSLRDVWAVFAVPHLAVRIKRLWPRALESRVGAIVVNATPEVARDLEWICGRYPMAMDDTTRRRLAEQAEAHRETEQAVMAILGGRRLDTGTRVPARAPYPEQVQAADLALTTGRLLIVDEYGLGKSNTALLVLRGRDTLPALVVTMTHLTDQWITDELAATWPDLLGHVIQSTRIYDPATCHDGRNPDVLAISYSKLAAWSDYLATVVNTVIFDEIQELRHEGTGKYNAAARLAHAARYRVGLSATPVYNYGGEMFNIVDVLAPDALGSKQEFLREYGSDIGGGKIKVKDPVALGDWLRREGLMIGRTRADVGRPLDEPVLIEQNVDADAAVLQRMSGDAIEMARFILDRANSRFARFQQAGELDKRVRQATGIAKAPFVAEFCRLLLESGTDRLVLFGWHRSVYDIWCERLADFHPVLYTGTESPAQKHEAAATFCRGDSRILIMSLRSGAGLDGLQYYCNTAVFGELDWSPQVPVQCLGRLRRDGMSTPPTGYFCISDYGSDPVMAEMLDIKRMQNDPMVNPRAATVQPVPDNTDRIRALAESVLRQEGNKHVA